MSSKLFEMLGIDEAEGIDPTEVERIKGTLSRIKVLAASVAKTNGTARTIEILATIEAAVERVVGSNAHSAEEAAKLLGTGKPGTGMTKLGDDSEDEDEGDRILVTPDEKRFLDKVRKASEGQMRALMRIVSDPSDTKHIPVLNDGSPKGTAEAEKSRDDAQAELAEAKTAKDKAERELAEQQDPKKSGSLAHQLAEAKAKATGLTDDQLKAIEKGRAAFKKRGTTAFGGGSKLTQQQAKDIDEAFGVLPGGDDES